MRYGRWQGSSRSVRAARARGTGGCRARGPSVEGPGPGWAIAARGPSNGVRSGPPGGRAARAARRSAPVRARAPLGLCSISNVTRSPPTRRSKSSEESRPPRWKKYSFASSAVMKPKPRSATTFLMVPVVMRTSNTSRTGTAERTVRSRRGSTTRSIVASCDERPIVARMFDFRKPRDRRFLSNSSSVRLPRCPL